MRSRTILSVLSSAALLLSTLAVPVGAQEDTTHPMESTSPSGAAGAIDSPAANLRTTLNLKLGEHIILALKATDAGLHGDTASFDAYNGLLNSNGTDIGAMLGSLYGQEAQDRFNVLWSAHNGGFVAYTTAVAAGDQAQQDQTLAELTDSFVPDFSTFIADATGLPLDAVTTLIAGHIEDTRVVIDAQAAADWTAAYAGVRSAFAHMRMIGDALAGALVAKFPDALPGDPNTTAADFRVALDQLLQEHMYLVSFTSAAQLAGHADEMAAAIVSLNTNGTDIGGAIGSLFGQTAADQFNVVWSAHNGLFVDYANGVLAGDPQAQDAAIEALTTDVVPRLSSFLASATGLPEDVLTRLVTDHITNTQAVIDAQAAGDAVAAAAADLSAAQHMQMIGDPLAAGIVAALPDSFPAASAAPATGDIITMVDVAFQPKRLTIGADTDATISLPNTGASLHTFVIDDLAIDVEVKPGETGSVTISAPAGTYTYYCSVPGHRAAGMEGTLTVE